MLGLERGKGGNIVVWLILGVLALAFGFTFGLPSDQLSFGESGLLKVHGENVTKEDFAYQRRAISWVIPLPEGEEAQNMGVREEVLEAVIERLVLVHVGEELGLGAELRDAELLTKDGFLIVLDQDRPWPWADKDAFDYEMLKRGLMQFNVSEARYLEIQRQELLARQVRDLIAASVTVPEAELWTKYEADNNQLSLRYVRFPVSDYSEIVDPTDDEIDAYIEKNADSLQESWETNQARFLKLPAQVDLRLIKFAKPIAPPPGSPAEMVAEHEAKLEAARAAVAAARSRITEGGETFAAVARELSIDADTARSGGYYGWAQVTDSGSGLEPVIDQAAQTLEDGQVSELIDGEEGLYLVMVAGHREGDVPEDIAKRELATNAVRSVRGRELAKRAAEEALLAVTSGTDLDELFSPGTPALGGPGGLPNLGGENIEDLGLGQPNGAPKRTIEETGLFANGQSVPGIGAQPTLTNKAWNSDPKAPILDEVFEVPGGFAIAAVDERQTATREGFVEARSELYRELATQRANGVISGFTKNQCFLGKARVDIRVNENTVKALMNYGGETPADADGVPLVPPYHVCDRVGDRGGLLQLAMMLRGQGNVGAPPGS
ncbi:Peptidyl-prolyl cis-trans isomerase PpiD [Enhygromyxa salina]|uniref:Periplasmic chaperone PpiD n=1 Tax=Enhygromyxa salina TaxID=215803 RepID=A0A0C2D488_9BACT|nr:peptidylprolyl isomerase [Enhygromyxa salina]KIG14907.1 Peptidyl-prolyl cis-trans isomerase PpiD [Enhygromyxa salina]